MDESDASSSEPPSRSPAGEPEGRQRRVRFELLDPDRLLGDDVRARLVASTEAALSLIEAEGEARARVVDDAAMSAAHLEYMDDGSTTDVLTFDMSDEAGLDVDLLICVDEARRHADRLGHALEHELTLYVVHGVLHCLGYDDGTEEEAERMHAEEDRLLSAAGIGPVFSLDVAGPGRTASGAGEGSVEP